MQDDANKSKSQSKVTKRNVSARCRAAGFASVAAFARSIGRATPVIYFALEMPSRFSPTYELIQTKLKP